MSLSENIKVLVVEDDLMVQKILAGFLQKLEVYKLVGKVSDLKNAKRFILHNKVDLILLDIYLPDGLGLELLKWIIQEGYKHKVILITADNRTDTLAEALRYGVVDYLVKPFRMERFNQALVKFKKNQELLMDKEIINQTDIDDMFNHKSQEINYVNKTSEMILQYLKGEMPKSYTATEIAKSVGISRITARKYLENMELSGEILLELSYGGVGRPKNKYRYGK